MKQSWDYIIVGAGTAGCVLAARLTEDPNVDVLVLEAGGRRLSPWYYIPVGYFKTVGNPRADWMYATEADPGLAGRAIPWPRGKVVGGSGSINGLVYVRGQPQDYDGWVSSGCEGWGWQDLLPYFKRAEHQERGSSEFHGAGGPLAVSDDRTSFEICHRFHDAAAASGLSRNADCNDGNQEGVGYYQTMSRGGVRSSTASGYLGSAGGRPNLTLVRRALCERLILEGEQVRGVAFRDAAGRQKTVDCDREVLLSAGAVASPALLLRSGIGPADHLREHGINPLVDLPGVGQHLKDHLKIHNSYRTRIPTLNDQLSTLRGKAGIAWQYLTRRRGPMTMAAAPVFCFARATPEAERPDVQFHVLPWSSSEPGSGRMHPFSGFTASICPLRPESSGTIRLRSADPAAPPRIQPNYLSTPHDAATAVAAIRLSRQICRHEPLKSAIAEEFAPGADAKSDEEILAFIRNNASTVFHPVGTCRMGTGPDSVVDPRLCVHGVAGLRVVDASIMPDIPSGNTNAPVVAIAEKASDLIREPAQP
ncbi:MAG: GMC family oxidoreductase N-terminal domain-containing protein [Pseudomonadota bacterium]